MTSISGFTFIHNAIAGGYPIVEAIQSVRPYVDEVVVVDMQSTDSTRQVLEALDVRILDGFWGNQAGETLRGAHDLYRRCRGDIIIHFDGDEVFGDRLIRRVIELIDSGRIDIAVMRLQIEQNFQRCRWYPEAVHRVFPRLSDTWKEGHTTNRQEQALMTNPEDGFLWDCTNCFRDNWLNRVNKQAELRGVEPQYLMVGQHCNWDVDLSKNDVEHWLKLGKQWTWTATPFNIPAILRPLVGMVKYEPKI